MLIVSSTSMSAALMGRIEVRPLTPSERTGALADAEIASGLSTVPILQPVYLEAQISLSIPASDIQSVSWEMTGKPVSSTAVLTDSPLGTNVPVYQPVDRLTY